MGYLDGVTGALIRSGADGQRYYAPFGKYRRVLLVPDDAAAARLQSRWKWFYLVMLGVTVVAVQLSQFSWRIIALAPLAGILAVPFGIWAGRDLPPASIAFADLPRLTRSEAMAAYGKRTGRRTLGALVALSLLMTLLGLFVASMSSDLGLWLSTAFFAGCTVVLGLAFRRAGGP